MSSAAITLSPEPARALSISETRLTVAKLQEQRKAILDLMKSGMKAKVDYGVVPGCDKPSLWKPGSEKILSMLMLAARPRVEDLSTPDCIRYRVHVEIIHIPTGTFFGEGIGEASSAESKYQWRAVVCDEEWNATPEDRRRIKWKKGQGKPYSVHQVRADMEDVANTVLKMSKKRAQIDATLTCTAASDIFSQDVEDIAEAGLDMGEVIEGQTQSQPLPQTLQRKDAAPVNQPAPQTAQPQHASQPAQQRQATQGGPTITEAQAKRFWAVAMQTHGDYKQIMSYLKDVLHVANKAEILASQYEDVMKWAEGK